MANTLIPTPWEKLFLQKVQGVKLSLKIACPFIKARYARLLLASLTQNPRLEVCILTRLKPADIVAGAMDLESLKLFCSAENLLPIRTRFLNRLHAKEFIFDHSEAIVTSTNLTYAELNTNAELGVSLTADASVTECEQHFNYLWEQSEDVTKEKLATLDLEIPPQRLAFQRERFLSRLASPQQKVEDRKAFAQAIEDNCLPEEAATSEPVRAEFLEPVISLISQPAPPQEEAAEVAGERKPTADDEAKLEELKGVFKKLFDRDLSRPDAVALFVHSSLLHCYVEELPGIHEIRRRYELVGKYARNLLVMKHVLSSSRERTAIQELVAKMQFINSSRWYESTLNRLGLGIPVFSKGTEREISDPKTAMRVANYVLGGCLGWFSLNDGLEALFAVNNSYFDFSEEFPYDILSGTQYKGLLQEYTQSRFSQLPSYTIKERQGAEHALAFVVEVTIPGRRVFKGCGSTVKEAETNAAKRALDALGREAITELGATDSAKKVKLQPGDLHGDEVRRLHMFWNRFITPLATSPFDWRSAATANATTMRLRGYIEQSLRQRYSVFGDLLFNYFASIKLSEIWGENGCDSVSHNEFMMAIRKRDSLVKVYDTLGLGDYAILHKAESCVPPAAKEDTIQAFLSYLLLTFGEREAKKFFDEVVKVVLPSGRLEENLRRNFKGALLERVQSVFRNEVPVVEFRVIRNLIGKVGFDVQLFVAAQAFEMGTGRSKTDAEHDAARKTLESVNFEQFLRLHAKAVPRQEEPNKTQGL